MPYSFTLTQARAAIEAELAANAAADVDKVTRSILDNKDEHFRRWLRIIDKIESDALRANAHYFSENWTGPALEDAIYTCRFHRRQAEQRSRVAA